ncbi:MAG TPA: right-handed parallel beta-helix repeat-containing protein [Anaeromyxobacter sp.]|nr:right-handed parallel beta-helix repeat-containing protein [Anaeromyxobacter sp.]
MRRLLPVLLAALVACQVDVEGAPCRPGHAEDCPSGQGCGLDKKCSLLCGEQSGALGCKCPPNDGPEFAADPAGSRIEDAPYPTGVMSPVACRFGRLGDALDAAAAYATSHADTGAVTRAYGDAPVFGVAETGEAFPLHVAAGVTLIGTESTNALTTVRADSSPLAAVIDLQGVIERVALEGAAAEGVGVAASCGATGTPSLRHVAVDGAGLLATGVAVSGACGADLDDVEVRQTVRAALLVDAAERATVNVVGGGFRESGIGVEVRGGTLHLEGPPGVVPTFLSGFTNGVTLEVVGNANHGIALVGGATPITLGVSRVRISGNAGTGIRIDDLPTGSSVAVVDSEISGNTSLSDGSLYASGRRAGGLILNQSVPPPFVFKGNVVACNDGDQLGFYASSVEPMKIGPDACGPESNFVRTKTGATAVFVSPYISVDARNNFWAPDPPTYVGTGFVYRDACPIEPPPPVCP